MSVKEQLDSVLKTLEDAVQKHLEEEQIRIDNLRAKILDAVQKLTVVNARDQSLVEDITYATERLADYKPLDIFKQLSGGKRMKRSRRSNRKSVRK